MWNNKSNKSKSLTSFSTISVGNKLEGTSAIALVFASAWVSIKGEVGEWAVEALL